MEYIREEAKDLQVLYNVDVCILGGGPTGFSAAVNCGRLGLKTLLIEQNSVVGGIATAGLMSHWTGQTEGPFYEELLGRARVASRDYQYTGDKNLRAEQIIDPEQTKLVMLEMLVEAEVALLLYTFACGVVMNRNQLSAVIIENKSGRSAVTAGIFIDATGDGDIAAKAGVEYFIGRETDGKMQPVTHMFKVAGVNTDMAVYPGEFDDNMEVPKGKIQDLGLQELEFPLGHVLLYPGSVPGVVTVNMTNCLGIDGTNTEELSLAELECRRQIPTIIKFLQSFVPGFEKCFCISSSSVIGVRETRHFKGLYTITEDDIEKATTFDDWIVTKAYFNFDVHGLTSPGLDSSGSQKEFTQRQKKKYTIPLGCFIPEKIDSLFLAGRNISGTHMAHSNYRVMPICVNMGQGVAAAAKVCVGNQMQPREVNIKEIQTILIEQGVTP